MKDIIPLGITLPREIVRKIDNDRGDVPRSRFLLRLVERAKLYEVLYKQGIIKKE